MASIRPATATTLYVEIANADLTQYDGIRIALVTRYNHLFFDGDRVDGKATEDGGSLFIVTLTPDETRVLTPGTQAKVQLEFTDEVGPHVTDIDTISIDETLFA